jgi:hypothetical protein
VGTAVGATVGSTTAGGSVATAVGVAQALNSMLSITNKIMTFDSFFIFLS